MHVRGLLSINQGRGDTRRCACVFVDKLRLNGQKKGPFAYMSFYLQVIEIITESHKRQIQKLFVVYVRSCIYWVSHRKDKKDKFKNQLLKILKKPKFFEIVFFYLTLLTFGEFSNKNKHLSQTNRFFVLDFVVFIEWFQILKGDRTYRQTGLFSMNLTPAKHTINHEPWPLNLNQTTLTHIFLVSYQKISTKHQKTPWHNFKTVLILEL